MTKEVVSLTAISSATDFFQSSNTGLAYFFVLLCVSRDLFVLGNLIFLKEPCPFYGSEGFLYHFRRDVGLSL